jgi:hypothetical protein
MAKGKSKRAKRPVVVAVDARAVIEEHVGALRSFTSIDIANETKRRGTWVANRDVAAILKGIAPWLGGNGYAASRIRVTRAEDGSPVAATLYHPAWVSPDAYDAVAQRPVTPDEFRALHPVAAALPPPPQPQQPPSGGGTGGGKQLAFPSFKFVR